MISNHLALRAEDTIRIEIVLEPLYTGCIIGECSSSDRWVTLTWCHYQQNNKHVAQGFSPAPRPSPPPGSLKRLHYMRKQPIVSKRVPHHMDEYTELFVEVIYCIIIHLDTPRKGGQSISGWTFVPCSTQWLNPLLWLPQTYNGLTNYHCQYP